MAANAPSDSRDAALIDGGIAAVAVRGLTKRYGQRTVVDGISFTVAAGEVFALLGPNGAGKTTTVEILEGYRRPDGGSATVLGRDPSRQGRQLRQEIGLMLQQGGIYPQLRPLEALRLFAAFYPDPQDPERLLQRLDLESARRTRFRNLSGGQKQRLSLALALVGKPKLVFLDEPTAAMDPQARRATWEIVRELKADGVTVFLTTHFMDEAEQLADRVAIMNHGRIVALDTPIGLRQTVTKEIRFRATPPPDPSAAATALGLPADAARAGENGEVVLSREPTPRLVAELAAWLAEQGSLVTDLRAGSRTLEEAFLEITGLSTSEL